MSRTKPSDTYAELLAAQMAMMNLGYDPLALGEEKQEAAQCGPAPWHSIVKGNGDWQMTALGNPDVNRLCVRECGGGGDCMFYAIGLGLAMSEGKSPTEIRRNDVALMTQARQWLADSITPENVDQFIRVYQSDWYASDMRRSIGLRGSWPTQPETWKPIMFGTDRPLVFVYDKIKRSQDFEMVPPLRKYLDVNDPNFVLSYPPPYPADELEQRLYSAQIVKTNTVRAGVKKLGYVYQGDSTSLEYLVNGPEMKRRDLGFLVLSNNGRPDCGIYPVNEPRAQYMILYNKGNYHWQLGGYAIGHNQVQILLHRRDLPFVLTHLYEESCGGVPPALE